MVSPTLPLRCEIDVRAERAPGTEPSASHFTRPVCTVPRRKWMPPPIGFITTAATRSLETAARGSMPKPITRMGVIERAAAHAGEADDDADDEACEGDAEVDVHVRPFWQVPKSN